MIRQDINISTYKFIVDLYKHGIDDIQNNIGSFVMFRKYNIVNNVIYDTDIYFIEKNILDEFIIIEDDIKKSIFDYTKNDKIVFPTYDGNNMFLCKYSTNISDFNYNFDENSIINDAYELYTINDDGTIKTAEILCDKVRIYRPDTTINNEIIVHVDNFINDIHFHYYCRPVKSLDRTYSENHFKIDNNNYSEYYEIMIPNVEYLFKENNIYFIENLNIIANSEDIVPIINNEQLFPLSLLVHPFKIIKGNSDREDYYKEYVNIRSTIETNYITYPINIKLYPYNGKDDAIYYGNVQSNSDTYVMDVKFSLKSRCGFDENNGILSIINEFIYPNNPIYNNFPTVWDAWQYYYNVSKQDYDYIRYHFWDKHEDEEYAEYQDRIIDLAERYKCNVGETIEPCYYVISIFNDINNANKIYYKEISTDVIDDFTFNLNGIVDSWDQFTDMFIVMVTYIDKALGITISSNPVIIDKEYYKYLINETNINRIKFFDQSNNENKNINDDMKTIDLNKYNFIDNINCNIIIENKDNLVNNNSANQKILYRPYFYKTFDLQKIKIVSGLTQNIGINLSQYMTKVETFKLIIDNVTVNEIGRNDIYVIFSVNGGEISNTNGNYYITNQNNEYISSGNWTME